MRRAAIAGALVAVAGWIIAGSSMDPAVAVIGVAVAIAAAAGVALTAPDGPAR